MIRRNMKKYWKEILLAIIVSLVLIPLAIAWTLSFRLINTDTTNEWIGFWGGYLGSILGGAITLYVMWKTLQIEKSNREREERINYFNNIIHLWAELSESINEIKTYIDRCICENGNNNIEKVCIGEGHTIKVLVELKVTLTTRKNIYELQELLEILEQIKKTFDETMEQYVTESNRGFKPTASRERLQKNADNLVDIISKSAECLERVVNKNLYNK